MSTKSSIKTSRKGIDWCSAIANPPVSNTKSLCCGIWTQKVFKNSPRDGREVTSLVLKTHTMINLISGHLKWFCSQPSRTWWRKRTTKWPRVPSRGSMPEASWTSSKRHRRKSAWNRRRAASRRRRSCRRWPSWWCWRTTSLRRNIPRLSTCSSTLLRCCLDRLGTQFYIFDSTGIDIRKSSQKENCRTLRQYSCDTQLSFQISAPLQLEKMAALLLFTWMGVCPHTSQFIFRYPPLGINGY